MSDQYFPYVFDLSSGNVNLIQTARANPRVWLDRTGLHSTEADGTHAVDINADGSAALSGHVKASGVDLPLGAGSAYAATSAVDWQDNAAAVHAFIQAALNGNVDELIIEAVGEAGINSSILSLASTTDGSSADVTIQVGGREAILLNLLGQSDFLQLATTERLRLNVGSIVVTSPANTTFSVPHGLGVVPAFFIGFPAGWGGYLINPGGGDATNMKFQANVALSGNYVAWLAIG